jgi:acetolactate synthase regulatory subunit
MLDLFEESLELLAALEGADVDYAIAGAVALAIHGAPRATADLDLLVRSEDVERILGIARERGFTVEAAPMRLGAGIAVRRVTKISGEEALTLDLLQVNADLEGVWSSRQRVESTDGAVWVVSREGLIQMKSQAGRDQDLADIRRLQELDA